jgi:citrate lyase beta subunit
MTIDLNKFAGQISRLERANRAIEAQARTLAPRHAHHQPSHVMYGGAHLFSEKTFSRISELALAAFNHAAPNPDALAALIGESWDSILTQKLYTKVTKKISTEPLEDYRIDFEDGYGVRSDAEEDQHAVSAAKNLVQLSKNAQTPRSVGFRVKPLSMAGMRRSLRTLTLFVEQFVAAHDAHDGVKRLMVTLPKVTNPEQVATVVDVLEDFEERHHLGPGFFALEILIESPEAFLSIDGTIPLASIVAAARGRCQSLHFGVYDFTSSLGIGSAGQSIDHLACDFARLWMQVAAGLAPGLGLSDGIISRLPIVPKVSNHETEAEFKAAWRYNYQQILRSLSLGFYQGWDLHPAQLPVRHVANYVFIVRELDGAVARLKAFSDKASTASHVGGVFDDRASVLGLLNFFDRALVSGVVTSQELQNLGIDLATVRQSI